MEDLDKHFTLPIFGYENYETYLKEASSKRLMYNVKVPMFYLNAEDDPLIGTNSYPYLEIQNNENLMLGTTASGGHIGYLTGV